VREEWRHVLRESMGDVVEGEQKEGGRKYSWNLVAKKKVGRTRDGVNVEKKFSQNSGDKPYR